MTVKIRSSLTDHGFVFTNLGRINHQHYFLTTEILLLSWDVGSTSIIPLLGSMSYMYSSLVPHGLGGVTQETKRVRGLKLLRYAKPNSRNLVELLAKARKTK